VIQVHHSLKIASAIITSFLHLKSQVATCCLSMHSLNYFAFSKHGKHMCKWRMVTNFKIQTIVSSHFPFTQFYLCSRIITLQAKHGRPQTFFQGRAKFSSGLGQKHTFCLKNALKKILISFKKVKNILIWPAEGRQVFPSCHPLRTPMKQSKFSFHKMIIL